jgi:cytochrome c biogenesis protein CcmG/thiol:disulfide interchange protein DsbE
MNRWLLGIPLFMFVALASLFYFGMQRKNSDQIPSAYIGLTAPALGQGTLPQLPGVESSDLQTGQVTLVNFWASWCPPCRAEHPTLKALAAQGITVYGVNMMDDPDQAISFLAEDGNPFSGIVFDPKGKTRLDWGVSAPPETFIILGDGTIAYRFIGPLVGSDYEQRFLPELKKAMANP